MKRTYRRSQKQKISKEFRINEQIRAREVRLIDDEKIEVVPLHVALQRAEEMELDLVEVSPNSNPPVVKIIDYGKFQYQREKQKRKQKAGQRKVDTKGIRLSARISKHDLDVRQKQALKFLEKGHKVKIELILKGREAQHLDVAKKIVNDLIESFGNDINIEQPVAKLGYRLTAVISKKS